MEHLTNADDSAYSPIAISSLENIWKQTNELSIWLEVGLAGFHYHHPSCRRLHSNSSYYSFSSVLKQPLEYQKGHCGMILGTKVMWEADYPGIPQHLTSPLIEEICGFRIIGIITHCLHWAEEDSNLFPPQDFLWDFFLTELLKMETLTAPPLPFICHKNRAALY